MPAWEFMYVERTLSSLAGFRLASHHLTLPAPVATFDP